MPPPHSPYLPVFAWNGGYDLKAVPASPGGGELLPCALVQGDEQISGLGWVPRAAHRLHN